MFLVLLTLLAASTLLAGATPVCAQNSLPVRTTRAPAARIDPETAPRPAARAVHVAGRGTAIHVDGRLDEAAWREAVPITRFVQAVPETGRAATERTEVRIVYDARNLYVGAVMHQSVPLVVPSLEQDYETHDSDVFGIALDTYLDRRNAFMFIVNPGGAVKDGQSFDDSRDVNLAWEGVVTIETQVSDTAWTVEMAIPWTTLRFKQTAAPQDWGMQLMRRIRYKNEDDYWSPLTRRDRLHKMSRAGTLRGLAGLRQGRNLSVKPYTKVGDEQGTQAAATGGYADTGLDVKWGLTPGLTLDLTYRTDFSQVEVDEERVNLTRFSLFFPERREFFIENSGVFTFGDVTERNYRMGSSLEDFTLFHSRRIGLDGGRVVPILGGGRLTGRVGAFRVGLLDMQTQPGQQHLYPGGLFATTADPAQPAENFFVARVKRDLSGGSDIGAMMVSRQVTTGPDAGQYNRSFGVDANIRPLPNLIINSYLAAVDAPGPDTANHAGRLAVAWRDRLWDMSAFYKHVGAGFQPAVGFVRRAGVNETYGTVGIHPRVALPGTYELNPYVEMHYVADPGGALASRQANAGLAATMNDGGRFELKLEDRFERLDEPFAVAADATIDPGRYAFRDASITYESSGGRSLSGSVSLTSGQFFDGRRTSVGIGALWRSSAHFALDLTLDRNAIRLPAGAFDADVAGLRANLAVSRTMLASGFVQYNAAADQLVTNVRLDYIHAPLSDIFLVLVERRDLVSHAVLDRSLALKATKLLAF
ncbi:MAG: DUF5916 domain-containing protein [Gemmatimonadota bacterium]